MIKKMEICYGIAEKRMLGPSEEIKWLYEFGLGVPLVCASKNDVFLDISGYDPMSKSPHVVKIVLKRKDGGLPIVEFCVNGVSLLGIPELVWAE